MRIIVDAFGGDHAPDEIIKGCLMAKKEYDVEIALSGNRASIEECAKENSLSLDGIELFDADGFIPVDADPTTLLKEYANCSMAVGLTALKDGKGDAFVSAGSTGALVVGSSLVIRRIKGVRRAGIATVIPNGKGCFLMMDSGANAECGADMLVQFGMMGSAYMERIVGVRNPRVGLLNIGTEENKGLDLQRDAYRLLEKAPVNFIGNVEARGLPLGDCDVAVCDGFSGNIALKLIEGMAKFFSNELKEMMFRNFQTKMGALLLKSSVKEFKGKLDYKEHGGAPLLGVNKIVIKAHGSSDAKAIKNAVRQAKNCIENQVIEEISLNLNRMKEMQRLEAQE